MEELTLNREPRSPAKKRSLDAMRRPSANQSDGPVPMMIDGEGPTDSSSADSAPSGGDESFEQLCDRHVRRFLKASPLKPRDKEGFGKSQQGLEHGDRTPSGGVYIATGVPRMHGGGNCLGSSDSIGSGKSDMSSQGDPSELSPDEMMKPAQQISAQVVAGQPNPGPQTDPQTNPPNPVVVGAESENRSLSGRLRGGSAGLEISNVAKFFAGGETETKDSQPRGFEPLDLPSSSTQGQAVLPEPEGGEEDSPPSRDVPNFPYFRNPGTLLNHNPGASVQKPQTSSGPSTSRGVTGQSPPGASPSPPGTDQSPQGTDRSAQGTENSPRGTDSTQPTSPQSFHQRVEFLSQQFIDPPSNPGSSDSHSGRSSFDSNPPSSGSPEDGPRDGSPPTARGGEPVPWRELFDLLPEARTRFNSAGHTPASQPGTSSQPGPSTSRPSAISRPRRSFTLSPIASPDRSIVLPGLPDDLAVLCLARVPRAVLARVVCVSKAWSVLIRSEELYKVRGENRLREPWLYALCESPRWGPWRVYDPMFSRWHTLPSPLPGADRQLVHAKFSTIALHEKMLVIGGCYFRSGDPTEGTMLEMDQHALRDLRVYDPVKNRWSWAEQMNIARRSFAIGEIEGKVYVAGGLGQNGELLSSAEVYDPSTNRWTMLPSMSVARYGCAGAVLHGKLWAYAGRQQTGEENPGGWKASSSAEVYDPIHATWRTVDEMWMRRDLPNPAAVLDELLYTVDCEDDCKIKCYQEPTNSWTVVDRLPLPAEFKHAGSRLVAFNNELYMLGGTIFYRDGDLNRGRNVNTVEVFDPKAQARGEVSWRSAPNMGEGRGGIWGCAVLNL